jgi:hypothetical protein
MERATLDALRAALPNLDAQSRVFAESLLRQADLPRGLSVKQQAWVPKLIARANQRTAAPVAANVVNPNPVVNPSGVTTLRGWLDRMAAGGVLRPRLHYATGGRNYVFARPSQDSRYAGQPAIFVRVDRSYAGRIQTDDNCERFYSARENGDVDGTVRGLDAILSAPLAQAVASGHATGNCCFCGRDLSDARSVARGYGPICADRLGLPWGENPEADRAAVRAEVQAVVADSAPILPMDGDGPDDEDRRFM